MSTWAKKEGFPEFDRQAVVEHANKLEMGLGSKEAIKLAYLSLHESAVDEARKKAYLAESQGPSATAERPGSSAGNVDLNAGEDKSIGDMVSDALKSIHRKS